MLQVDLRELARGPVEMRADLAGTDPLFEGLEVTLAEPVQVAGRLQDAGDGRFYCRAPLGGVSGGLSRVVPALWQGPQRGRLRLPGARGPSVGRAHGCSAQAPRLAKDDSMAVPKRRTSKRKKRARRTHYKAAPIALQPCPRCGDLKRPHHVCPTCGYYRDEQRIAVEDA